MERMDYEEAKKFIELGLKAQDLMFYVRTLYGSDESDNDFDRAKCIRALEDNLISKEEYDLLLEFYDI